MSRAQKIATLGTICGGLIVIFVAVIGIRVVSTANLAKAKKIAANLQATVAAHPNPATAPTTASTSAQPSTPAPDASVPAASQSSSPTTRAASPSRIAAPSSAPAPAAASAPAATSSTSSTSASTATSSTTTKTPVTSGVKSPANTTVARTVPTGAEVQDAITAVHAIVPFYTPTPADIASAGNEVCTALDQGGSLTQVQAAALSMIGASQYASFIPSADTQVAIQTLVALYCPGYAARVG